MTQFAKFLRVNAHLRLEYKVFCIIILFSLFISFINQLYATETTVEIDKFKVHLVHQKETGEWELISTPELCDKALAVTDKSLAWAFETIKKDWGEIRKNTKKSIRENGLYNMAAGGRNAAVASRDRFLRVCGVEFSYLPEEVLLPRVHCSLFPQKDTQFDWRNEDLEQTIAFMKRYKGIERIIFPRSMNWNAPEGTKEKVIQTDHATMQRLTVDFNYLHTLYEMILGFLDRLEEQGFKPCSLAQMETTTDVSLDMTEENFNKNYAALLFREFAKICSHKENFFARIGRIFQHIRPIQEQGEHFSLVDPEYFRKEDGCIFFNTVAHFLHNAPLPDFSAKTSNELQGLLRNFGCMGTFYRFSCTMLDEIMPLVERLEWHAGKEIFQIQPLLAPKKKPKNTNLSKVENPVSSEKPEMANKKASRNKGKTSGNNGKKAQRSSPLGNNDWQKHNARVAEEEADQRKREEQRRREAERELREQQAALSRASQQAQNLGKWRTAQSGQTNNAKKPQEPITQKQPQKQLRVPRQNNGEKKPVLPSSPTTGNELTKPRPVTAGTSFAAMVKGSVPPNTVAEVQKPTGQQEEAKPIFSSTAIMQIPSIIEASLTSSLSSPPPTVSDSQRSAQEQEGCVRNPYGISVLSVASGAEDDLLPSYVAPDSTYLYDWKGDLVTKK